jgi:glycosyltransferase involved in cell wall biosynthesis
MNSSRILFVASVPYPFGWAASARLRNLVAGFEANDWHAEVCLFGRPPEEASAAADSSVRWCLPDSRGDRFGRQYAYYIAPKVLARQIQNESVYKSYDCVYLYARAYTIVAPLITAFQRIGVRVIVDVNEAHSHFSGFGGALSPNYWNSYFGYRYAIPRADFVACISQQLCRFYRDLGANTVLLPSVESYNRIIKKDESKLATFLYSGSFYERDNPSLMLDIVEGLLSRGCQLKFLVTGPYESNSGANQYLERIRLTDCLRSSTSLLGRVPEQQYMDIRQAADFGFILRRDHHAERASFPTRLVEFIRDGIIPITTAVPDVPDYLNHGVDSIFTSSNIVDETIGYLASVCSNSAEMSRLRDCAFKSGKQHFCAKKNVTRLIEHLKLGG